MNTYYVLQAHRDKQVLRFEQKLSISKIIRCSIQGEQIDNLHKNRKQEGGAKIIYTP